MFPEFPRKLKFAADKFQFAGKHGNAFNEVDARK